MNVKAVDRVVIVAVPTRNASTRLDRIDAIVWPATFIRHRRRTTRVSTTTNALPESTIAIRPWPPVTIRSVAISANASSAIEETDSNANVNNDTTIYQID